MSQDNQGQAVLLAYLAGIIDGEGTIRIGRNQPSNKKWNLKYYASISVGMVLKEIPEMFAQEFGANVRIERVPEKRPIYRWGTSGNKTVPRILKQLLPYLRVKKVQAIEVIKFCEEQMIGFKRNNGLPIQELRRRERSYQKVRKLNAVGAAATK